MYQINLPARKSPALIIFMNERRKDVPNLKIKSGHVEIILSFEPLLYSFRCELNAGLYSLNNLISSSLIHAQLKIHLSDEINKILVLVRRKRDLDGMMASTLL